MPPRQTSTTEGKKLKAKDLQTCIGCYITLGLRPSCPQSKVEMADTGAASAGCRLPPALRFTLHTRPEEQSLTGGLGSQWNSHTQLLAPSPDHKPASPLLPRLRGFVSRLLVLN